MKMETFRALNGLSLHQRVRDFLHCVYAFGFKTLKFTHHFFSVGTCVAAFFGSTPIIVCVECAAGVKEGGKTGENAFQSMPSRAS